MLRRINIKYRQSPRYTINKDRKQLQNTACLEFLRKSNTYICNRKNEQINSTTKTTPTTYTLKNEVSFTANSNRMNQNILTHNGTKTNKKKVTIYKQFIICRMK